MKKLVFALAGALALGACESPDATGTVVDPLVGKSLVAESGNTFIFNADGTAGGMFRGEEVVGTYSANATEVCSTYSAPEALTGREYCSVPAISDGTVIFNRRDGSQSALYKIEG